MNTPEPCASCGWLYVDVMSLDAIGGPYIECMCPHPDCVFEGKCPHYRNWETFHWIRAEENERRCSMIIVQIILLVIVIAWSVYRMYGKEEREQRVAAVVIVLAALMLCGLVVVGRIDQATDKIIKAQAKKKPPAKKPKATWEKRLDQAQAMLKGATTALKVAKEALDQQDKISCKEDGEMVPCPALKPTAPLLQLAEYQLVWYDIIRATEYQARCAASCSVQLRHDDEADRQAKDKFVLYPVPPHNLIWYDAPRFSAKGIGKFIRCVRGRCYDKESKP